MGEPYQSSLASRPRHFWIWFLDPKQYYNRCIQSDSSQTGYRFFGIATDFCTQSSLLFQTGSCSSSSKVFVLAFTDAGTRTMIFLDLVLKCLPSVMSSHENNTRWVKHCSNKIAAGLAIMVVFEFFFSVVVTVITWADPGWIPAFVLSCVDPRYICFLETQTQLKPFNNRTAVRWIRQRFKEGVRTTHLGATRKAPVFILF